MSPYFVNKRHLEHRTLYIILRKGQKKKKDLYT